MLRMAAPGLSEICSLWSNVDRCRGWRPPGCLNVSIFAGPNWLDAEVGGPQAVDILVFLVIAGLDAEGSGRNTFGVVKA